MPQSIFTSHLSSPPPSNHLEFTIDSNDSSHFIFHTSSITRMSFNPHISRFSDESSVPGSGQQISADNEKANADSPNASDEHDTQAIQSYADYVRAYKEWKGWLAKLSDAEDRLETISLQLEHFAGDGLAQQRVLIQWRSERLRWHDLTRLTYIALHKCAFHMTEYHNLLTELYNQAEADAGRLARELQDAKNTIQDLSMRLQATVEHVQPSVEEDDEVS